MNLQVGFGVGDVVEYGGQYVVVHGQAVVGYGGVVVSYDDKASFPFWQKLKQSPSPAEELKKSKTWPWSKK